MLDWSLLVTRLLSSPFTTQCKPENQRFTVQFTVQWTTLLDLALWEAAALMLPKHLRGVHAPILDCVANSKQPC